jgi:hypothetical protein
MASPPPNYDNVVGTPSHDGLADYFARMANVYSEGQGEGGVDSEDDDEDVDGRQEGSEGESGNESKIRRNTSRGGRVYISNPMSPSPRAPSHSMEINRDFMFRREVVDGMRQGRTGSETMSQPGGSQPGDNTSRA